VPPLESALARILDRGGLGLPAVPASGTAPSCGWGAGRVCPVGASLLVPALARGTTGLGIDVSARDNGAARVEHQPVASPATLVRLAGPPGASELLVASMAGSATAASSSERPATPTTDVGHKGTGDRPPPPACNATSATTRMTSRTRTRMSRKARRLGERAATGQMGTTASAMTTGKTSHRALELTANTKRPPGRAARRSVGQRPARRSEGQTQGAEAAMWCPKGRGPEGQNERDSDGTNAPRRRQDQALRRRPLASPHFPCRCAIASSRGCSPPGLRVPLVHDPRVAPAMDQPRTPCFLLRDVTPSFAHPL
jgi:hypothetical protein